MTLPKNMKWILLGLAGAIALACWIALGLGFIYRPDRTIWIAIVTATAVTSEAFLWIAAAVFGWSILSGRKKMLQRWFGKKSEAG